MTPDPERNRFAVRAVFLQVVAIFTFIFTNLGMIESFNQQYQLMENIMNKSNKISLTLASLAISLFAFTVPEPAFAVELTVEIKGIASSTGDIYVALYDKAEKWMKTSLSGSKVAAKKGSVSVTFKDLPDGDYAISLYHDENSNGKMDSNVIGIPTEPYAFSNDAAGNFGPASFEQAKFKVDGEKKNIVINIK